MNVHVPVKRPKAPKRGRAARSPVSDDTTYEVTKSDGDDSASLTVTSKYGKFKYLIPSGPIEV